MKRKRRSRKADHGLPSPAALVAGESHEPSRRQAGRFRLWVFRLVALTLIPVVVLGLAELGLRVGGYGYRTSFFVKTRIRDQNVFVDNQEFGRRFFPVTMARSPSPLVLAAKKATNTYRIFVLGESAALGDPEPAFGAGRYLEVLLGGRYPGTRFEVVSAAVTAINSHALLPIARECAAHQGDLWVIYMGNNEVVGPFGAGTVLGRRTPPLLVIRSTLTLKRLRVGQFLDSLLGRFVRGSSSPKSWQGMQMFLEAQTRPDDPSRKRTHRYFQQNLEDILEVARDNGIKVVLSSVASNLKDCPPFASLHSANLSESERSSWETLFKQGVELERSTNWTAALETYRQAAIIDDQYAELQYRMGRCYLALTNASEAGHCFELARDFDGLSFRADATINASIRGLADRSKPNEILLVDAAAALAKASPDGICGSELFFEHVHLNPRGNYLLARAFGENAAVLLPAAITNRDQGAWLSAEACDAQLCISPWDRHRLDQNILQRERQAPFTLQLDHANRVQLLSIKLAEHRAAMSRTATEQTRTLYQQTLTKRPDDFYLHGNFAKFLEDTGNYAAAVQEWEQVQELLPYHFGPGYYLGKALGRLGKYSEAEGWLKKTLRLRPDAVEAMDELAQQLVRQKRPSEALPYLQSAIRLQPGDGRLHLHLADALGALNRRQEAMASLQRAVELRPDYWEARYLLGVELAVQNRLPEASEQFTRVLQLNPDYPLAHLNLGVALAKQNRFAEAIQQFRETLKIDPSNKSAQEYLAKLKAATP